MNEPFCWDTLIAKIPRLAKGMKTSLEKLGSWLLIFLPGLMFSFYLLAAKESLLRMGSFLIDRCFGGFPREKNTLCTDGSQSVLPSFSGRTDHRDRNPRYALYHRHVDSASPLCCHDRLSGRCNRTATGHRSLYRCRSRCVYASYGFPGKSTGISYLFNNSPADRRQFYLSPCGRTSIGLPGIWVLAAVIVGGGAFGIGESCLPCHLQQPSTGCSVPQSIKAVQQCRTAS